MSKRNEEKNFINNYVPLSRDDFYLKSKLQDVLRNPSQYFANAQVTNFDIIHCDLKQKKMDHSLEHYQTIFKRNFDKFDEYTTDYLVSNACRAQRNDIFFEKDFDRELFLKKKSACFLVCTEEKILL